MSEVKLNIVKNGEFQYPKKPGDAIVVNNGDHISLVWCCPRCGKATSTARGCKHVYNEETRSLNPSIVHSKKLGGCGYHGLLTNGIFKEV